MKERAPISLPRRLALAGIAAVIAALCFRGPVVEGIVTRGDAYFQRGETARALGYYARAARLDAGSPLAAERFTTLALVSGDHRLMEEALALADGELAARPGDGTVMQNRALIEYKLGRRRDAARDIRAAAFVTGSLDVVLFAARSALRDGDRAGAVRLLRRAAGVQRDCPPCRAMLRRLGVRS